MTNKKHIVIAVLATLCLTSTLFMILPTRSQPGGLEYNPWADLNDDGIIDVYDVVMVTGIYDSEGTPVNKTTLLLDVNATFTDLLSRIDGINNTLSQRISSLDAQLATMDAAIMQLQLSNADLSSRINALEANYSITNLRLAPYAIPFNSTYSTAYDYTTETYPKLADMSGMSVTLALERPCQLMIMLSAELQNLGPNTAREDTWIIIQATVNGDAALPSEFNTTAVDPTGAAGLVYHDHYLRWGTYSFFFNRQTLSAGFYTIKIRWAATVGKAEVRSRVLSVIALPT